jgi:membrane protease YdiL (CAAX protease family)
MQLLMFLLMSFTFMSSAGAIILGLFTKLTGYAPTQIVGVTSGSPFSLIKAALTVQGVENLFVFLLPAITFAYLTHPSPTHYLGLRKPGKNIQFLLVLLVMAGAMPVLVLIQNLISMIDFGAGVKAAQERNNDMMRAFMHIEGLGDFIRAFIIMAIVPAFGEEMFFRGTLMRFAKKRSPNMVVPIVFSALVFSFVHANVYGYLSIFLAGVLLAVIYNLTGSLWCSILAHLFFNGSQIVLQYLGNTNHSVKSFVEADNVPYAFVAAGALVFAGAFYLLWKNRTPLPASWAEDFTPAELATNKEEKRGRFF